MQYAVIGGDLRFAHLARMLEESGRSADGFFQEKAGGGMLPLRELRSYDCIVSGWPMKAPLSEVPIDEAEVMGELAPGSTLLLCGPKFPQKRRWDLQYVNLWADEALLLENAYLTAQAAVAGAQAHGKMSLSGARCAVLGYGRIGRALTDILTELGADVAAVTSRESKLAQIRQVGARGYRGEELRQALAGAICIFSTPPAMVLDRELLSFVDRRAQLVDLASPPYGIDLTAAAELGLDARREPGLPGRYCPLSAARAIYSAILRWEEEEIHARA